MFFLAASIWEEAQITLQKETDYTVQTDTDTSKGLGEELFHNALVKIAGHAVSQQ